LFLHTFFYFLKIARLSNVTVLTTNALFLEFFFMLLGILVLLIFFLEMSIRDGSFVEKNQQKQEEFFVSHFERGTTLKYSSSFMETLDFYFVLIPTLLVTFFIVPSMALIFALDPMIYTSSFNSTIWICGHQWYWSYSLMSELNDPFLEGSVLLLESSFDSILDPDSLTFRYQRVDHPLVVPLGSLNCFITSEDVVHSWALPSLSLKVDAVPGRAQSFTLSGLVHGVFFGQCSELCGVHHARMPIEVHFVPEVVWFINTVNETLTSDVNSSPIHHFVNSTVIGEGFYIAFLGGFHFYNVILLSFVDNLELLLEERFIERTLLYTQTFLLVLAYFGIVQCLITFEDFTSFLLNLPCIRLPNQTWVSEYLESFSSFFLDANDLFFFLAKFCYFTTLGLNQVSVLIVSFICFFYIVSFRIRLDYKKMVNFTLLYYIIYLIIQFVNKVVSDYLVRLNNYEIAYVHHFLPYFTWLFIFIFYMNLSGLLPFSFSLFSVGYVTLTLSAFTWLGHFLLGIHYKNLDFLLVYFDPELPGMVSGFVGMLELMSVLIRPISLGLRLTANMVGGHLIVELLLEVFLLFSNMVIYTPNLTSFVLFFIALVPVAVIYFYEFCVTFIQAYVFILLLLIYLREAVDLETSH
jgi:ATP synthase subunit 6